MGERFAATALLSGLTLFGYSITEVSEMATIFAGVTGGIASITAAVYYIVKTIRGK